MHANAGAGRRARVLVVDDEPPQRRLLRAVLEAGGLEVVEASSLREALEWLADPLAAPTVLVTELVVRGEWSLTLLQGLRSLPALANLPIVVTTGRTSEHDRAATLAAGADIFVTKPFSPTELIAQVWELVRHGRPRRAAGAQDRAEETFGPSSNGAIHRSA